MSRTGPSISFESRVARLAEKLRTAGPDGSALDAYLVTNLVNVEYLTGFTGTNGACLVGAGFNLFLTDFRYAERAGGIEGWDSEVISGQWMEEKSRLFSPCSSSM